MCAACAIRAENAVVEAKANNNKQNNLSVDDKKHVESAVVGAVGKRVNITYGTYFSAVPIEQSRNKAKVVIATTLLGGAIGGAAGGLAGGPIGAGPGAGIGFAVGFGCGMITVAAWDYSQYAKWKEQQSEDVVTSFYQKMRTVLKEEQFEDPLTNEILVDPVQTPDGHTFERRVIAAALARSPVCPVTTKPLKLQELRPSFRTIAAMFKACCLLMNSASLQFEDALREGINCLKADLRKNCKHYLQAEDKELRRLLDAKQITRIQFGRQQMDLAQVTDGIE